MKFLSTTEAAEKWNISQRRVIRLAGEGRIEGAVRFGNSWMIPDKANKPADGRTKLKNTPRKADAFRFPLYVNGSEDDFTPPLSAEEKVLRQAQLEFLSCDFEKSKKNMLYLMKNAESRYIKISALFFLAFLSVVCDNGRESDYYISLLNLALSEDFEHKKEMELHLPWYYGCLAQAKSAAKYFSFNPTYEYSPTVYPLLTYLILLGKASSESFEPGSGSISLYEIAVKHMEEKECFYESIRIHLALFAVYYMFADKNLAVYHLEKAIRIAFDRNFIYPIADFSSYYREPIEEALREYPKEFAKKVLSLGEIIDRSYSVYMEKYKGNTIWTTLSTSDWRFVLYAFRGYYYKQVAHLTNLSERTVVNRYADIYNKLGVDGKQELVALFTRSLSK